MLSSCQVFFSVIKVSSNFSFKSMELTKYMFMIHNTIYVKYFYALQQFKRDIFLVNYDFTFQEKSSCQLKSIL